MKDLSIIVAYTATLSTILTKAHPFFRQDPGRGPLHTLHSHKDYAHQKDQSLLQNFAPFSSPMKRSEGFSEGGVGSGPLYPSGGGLYPAYSNSLVDSLLQLRYARPTMDTGIQLDSPDLFNPLNLNSTQGLELDINPKETFDILPEGLPIQKSTQPMDTVPLGQIPLGQIPPEEHRSRPITWFDDVDQSQVVDLPVSSADRYKDLVQIDVDSTSLPQPSYTFGPATILNSELGNNLALHGSLTKIRGRHTRINMEKPKPKQTNKNVEFQPHWNSKSLSSWQSMINKPLASSYVVPAPIFRYGPVPNTLPYQISNNLAANGSPGFPGFFDSSEDDSQINEDDFQMNKESSWNNLSNDIFLAKKGRQESRQTFFS